MYAMKLFGSQVWRKEAGPMDGERAERDRECDPKISEMEHHAVDKLVFLSMFAVPVSIKTR